MPQTLRNNLDSLGLLQYLGAFQAQGFDTWDVVLDITEGDLEALGVKLGHRRKLQRHIAHCRGVPANTALPTPNQTDIQDSSSLEGEQPSASRDEGQGEGAVKKRRYRRHPKPDKNAPERPASAYVLFSNKTREDLKDQYLSFTEIAKIVGERWQCISKGERGEYERHARHARDKYRRELAEYKKTPEHEHYAQYLEDFKKKHQAAGKAATGSFTSGTGRSNSSSASNGVSAGSNRPPRDGPYRRLEPAGQQGSGSVNTPSESRQQQQQISPESPFRTRNIQTVTQNGSTRHQKLPSLSEVLDRTDDDKLATAHHEGMCGPCSQLGRSIMPPEQTVAGGSPVSTASGYALSESEADFLPTLSSSLRKGATSAHKKAPSLPGQPMLQYDAYR